MRKCYIITEDHIIEALEYIAEAYDRSERAETEEDRKTYFELWRGARHILRRLGFKISDLKKIAEEVTTA